MTSKTILTLSQEEVRHAVEAWLVRQRHQVKRVEFYDLDRPDADPETKTGGVGNLVAVADVEKEVKHEQ